MIKKLDQAKQKEKSEAKKREREEEVKAMQEQMEGVKKERIEALNAEFEDKKRRLMEGRSARKSQLSSTPSNKPTRYSYQPSAPALLQTTPDPSPGPFQPATSPDPTAV